MKKMMIGAAALLTTFGGLAAGVGSAQAYPFGWHGHYWHRGYGPGLAVAAGLTGLAVGAAVAHPYYGPAYYAGGYYAPAPAYYPLAPRYYAGPRYYARFGGCHREWVWTRFGGYRLARACY